MAVGEVLKRFEGEVDGLVAFVDVAFPAPEELKDRDGARGVLNVEFRRGGDEGGVAVAVVAAFSVFRFLRSILS